MRGPVRTASDPPSVAGRAGAAAVPGAPNSDSVRSAGPVARTSARAARAYCGAPSSSSRSSPTLTASANRTNAGVASAPFTSRARTTTASTRSA